MSIEVAPAPVILVMGVSGCGKSSLGRRLATQLGCEFVEGDSFHPPSNIEKMARGQALDDADRYGWLDALAAEVSRLRQQGRGVVLSCSALKRAYRDTLRSAAPDLRLVHLAGDFDLLQSRMAKRTGHYMPPSLLKSQFSDLQAPQADENPVLADVGPPVEQVLAFVLAALDNPSTPA